MSDINTNLLDRMTARIAERSDDRLESTTVDGTLNYDHAVASVAGVVEPHMYDDGLAVWVLDNAIVSVDALHLTQVKHVVTTCARVQDIPGGWVRIHPSHYGIEVDSFYEHHGEPASVPAHEAWAILTTILTD